MNKKNYPIDLNADLGEGGQYDAALLKLVTSTNIACGGHTGDQQSMRTAVAAALKNRVKIGAHPSYPDPINFGRQSMDISSEQLRISLLQQINSLKSVCKSMKTEMFHVKPHGAFYNEVSNNEALGLILIDVIKQIDPKLKLMVLAGTPLVHQVRHAGICVIEEAFADRAYLNDGFLAPRDRQGAIIEDDDAALKQVRQLIQHKPIQTLDGQRLLINADSICLHGDNKHALAFAQKITLSFKYLKR